MHASKRTGTPASHMCVLCSSPALAAPLASACNRPPRQKLPLAKPEVRSVPWNIASIVGRTPLHARRQVCHALADHRLWNSKRSAAQTLLERIDRLSTCRGILLHACLHLLPQEVIHRIEVGRIAGEVQAVNAKRRLHTLGCKTNARPIKNERSNMHVMTQVHVRFRTQNLK